MGKTNKQNSLVVTAVTKGGDGESEELKAATNNSCHLQQADTYISCSSRYNAQWC